MSVLLSVICRLCAWQILCTYGGFDFSENASIIVQLNFFAF